MFTLHNGDNLPFLRSLESDMIDLIYIDPPYFSQRNYGDFDDRWKSIQHYIDFMVERLKEMHRVLKPTGSIYVHLDWHAVHYVKVEMDKIFGYNNFVNEIIWGYRGGGVSKKAFARKHDTILFYSKSEKYTYNVQYQEYSEASKKLVKSKGGVSIDGMPRDLERGCHMVDWWSDINAIQTWSPERSGYATQKPAELMKRIVLASSNENDIVADFFCGSGSFLKVAHGLGRSCIGCDSNQSAVLRLKSYTPSNNRMHLTAFGASSAEVIPLQSNLFAEVPAAKLGGK
jgi:site-specific DNA-methyltransferase (adenine-specific)